MGSDRETGRQWWSHVGRTTSVRTYHPRGRGRGPIRRSDNHDTRCGHMEERLERQTFLDRVDIQGIQDHNLQQARKIKKSRLYMQCHRQHSIVIHSILR